jgi:hypothetical protein
VRLQARLREAAEPDQRRLDGFIQRRVRFLAQRGNQKAIFDALVKALA